MTGSITVRVADYPDPGFGDVVRLETPDDPPRWIGVGTVAGFDLDVDADGTRGVMIELADDDRYVTAAAEATVVATIRLDPIETRRERARPGGARHLRALPDVDAA